MEVVAKKFNRKSTFIIVLIACIFMALVGVGLLVASGYIVNYPDALDIIGFVLILLGVILSALMIYALVVFIKLPEDLITFENGVFTFPKGVTCRAEEITDVSYDSANPSYKSVSYDFGFGQIKLRIGDKKVKIKYVSNPSEVAKRMKELVREAKFLASSQLNKGE